MTKSQLETGLKLETSQRHPRRHLLWHKCQVYDPFSVESNIIGLARKHSDKMNHLAYGAIHTNSSATRYHKKHNVYDVDPTELHDAYMDLRIIRDSRTGNISLRPRLLVDCSDGIHQVHFDWNSHKRNNTQHFTCSTMLSKPNKVIRCYVEPRLSKIIWKIGRN